MSDSNHRLRDVLLSLGLIAILSASDCINHPDGCPPFCRVLSMTVRPSADTVGVGAAVELTATALDERGDTVDWVDWSSSDTAIAMVRPGLRTGFVTGIAPGTALITATAEGVGDTAQIFVVEVCPPICHVASVTVAPSADTIGVGKTIQLTATVLDSSGRSVPGVRLEWSSSDSAVAIVSESGLVTGTGPGAAVLTATANGVDGVAQLRVFDVGAVAGRMAHVDIEGGFYAIRGDNAITYDPINLPPAFQRDDLPVLATLRLRPDLASVHMVGPVVEVLSIRER